MEYPQQAQQYILRDPWNGGINLDLATPPPHKKTSQKDCMYKNMKPRYIIIDETQYLRVYMRHGAAK